MAKKSTSTIIVDRTHILTVAFTIDTYIIITKSWSPFKRTCYIFTIFPPHISGWFYTMRILQGEDKRFRIIFTLIYWLSYIISYIYLSLSTIGLYSLQRSILHCSLWAPELDLYHHNIYEKSWRHTYNYVLRLYTAIPTGNHQSILSNNHHITAH